MEVNELVIAEADDPRRCAGMTGKGQCRFLSLDRQRYCHSCISAHRRTLDNREIEVYNLTKWRGRLNSLISDEGIKSLRDEIGILRMTLEATVQRCHTEKDLILQSSTIQALTGQIERLITSCAKLERQTGSMLDKTAALQIASNVVNIIGTHVKDATVVEAIADEIIEKILNVQYEEA